MRAKNKGWLESFLLEGLMDTSPTISLVVPRIEEVDDASHGNCVNVDGVSAYRRGGGQQLSRGIVAERSLGFIVAGVCDFCYPGSSLGDQG